MFYNSGITIIPIPYEWGQMNTTTQYVDARGRLHVIAWQTPLEALVANQH